MATDIAEENSATQEVIGKDLLGLIIERVRRNKVVIQQREGWMIIRLRRSAGVVLRRIQSIPFYRIIGRALGQYRLTIHEATDTDRLAVHKWFNPEGDPAWVLARNPHVTDLVAYSYGYLAGFVRLERYSPEQSPYAGYWLFNLAVKYWCKGAGIGEKLTRAVIMQATTEGQKTLDLLVFNNNVPAIQLYLKLGFVPHFIPELEPQLKAEGADSGRRRIVMRKLLNRDK